MRHIMVTGCNEVDRFEVHPPEKARRIADRRRAGKAAIVVMFLLVTSSFVSMNVVANAPGDDPVTHTVLMTDGLKFSPEVLEIEPGDTVVWKNEPGAVMLHTVTAYGDRIPAGASYFASGDFTSESAARSNLADGLIPADAEYSATFTLNGTYDYNCLPHELAGMVGSILVGDAGPGVVGEETGLLLPIVLGSVGAVVIMTLSFRATRRKRKVP